jgi:NAD(P)-dependent dehydrogenase (short-subunit alcohol dehydrogenase family)
MEDEARMNDLGGKAALITGASRGIGAATARRLAARGASIFLAGKDTADRFEAVAADCRRCAPSADAIVAYGSHDLLEQGAAEAMVAAAATALGRIDYLVNNAAIRIRHPFGAFSYADFEQMIATNLRGPLFASQAALPHMRKVGGGRIVHVASQMGHIAEHGSTLYGLTKAALIHLTRSMAFELARENIFVNAVSPGPTMSEYNRARTSADPALLARKLSYIPANRYAEPEEIAEVIEFLLTTRATFIQGHDLVVDGGYTIH